MTFSLLLPILLAPSAPAPPAKPPRPVTCTELAGHWKMLWGGTSYDVCFKEDGSYACRGPGGAWYGSWRLANGALTICERVTDTGSYSTSSPSTLGYVWTVNLRRAGLGTLNGPISHGGIHTSVQFSRTGNGAGTVDAPPGRTAASASRDFR